ncbi:AMP-binding protein, partial [Micromonospora sp. CPCC 205371]|nr:AMP-binding protein [Micromonospora sp. CPCC 205371]
MSTPDGRRPLSAAQAGMWFAQQRDPENPIFCGAQYLEISGPVRRDLLDAAVRQMVAESGALQVRFVHDEQGLWQVPVVHDWTTQPYVDLSAEPDPRAAAEAWIRQEMARPMRLESDQLFFFALLKLADDRYFWFQRGHHIAVDGYSSSLLAGRLTEIYTALVEGGSVEEGALGPLNCLLDDDAEYRASPQFEEDRAYWLKRMDGEPDVLSLADATAPPAHSFLRVEHDVPAETRDRISAVARQERTSSSVLICAAMAMYLSRMRGTRDVVLALPVAARFGALMRRTPGMVANMLPLRLTIERGSTCGDLIRQTKAEIREALRHQRYRFEDVRRDLRLPESHRLFGPAVDVLRFQEGLRLGPHPAAVNIVSNGPVYDFNLAVYSGADIPGLRVCMDANPTLYDHAALERHRDLFAVLLESFSRADLTTPVAEVDLMDATERRRVLSDWQGRSREIGAQTAVDLFEAQARQTPQRPAVVCGDTRLSYAELDAEANRWARHLISLGAGPERYVALAVPRSAEMMVMLLGVLKAGAAYLPLDVTHPAERLAHMIRHADPALVLTSTGTSALLAAHSGVREAVVVGPGARRGGGRA